MNVTKTVNPHFEKFLFDWDSAYYLLIGGYGSSKSYHVALKIVMKLLREKRTCLVVREVYDTIRDSCYALFIEICGSLELESYVKFTRSPMQLNFSNGSKIIFRGMDAPAKLKSIHDISLIWLEEAAEIKYAGFKELIGRLRHPFLPLHMILSLNPVAKSNWVFSHFFEQRNIDDAQLYGSRIMRVGDTYYHHSTCDDNKFLPSSYFATLEEMKSYDADLYRIARLGKFGVNGVRVLPQFEIAPRAEVEAAVDKIPRRFKFVGMDFGFVESYNAVVRCAVDDQNKWLYIYWEYYRNNMTDDETADALKEFIQTREVIKADSAEPKAIRYYQRRGFNMVAAKKWNGGTRHARLDNTRKMKRFRRIICSDACANCIKELADLTFATDRNGEIIPDEFNRDPHTFSALWYALDTYDVADAKNLLTKGDLGL